MTPRKRTNAYWDKRSQEQLTLVEQQALPHLKEIDMVFRNSQKQTLKDVKNLYEVYYRKQGFDTTALKAIAPNGDIRRFKESVKALGLSSRLPAGYGYRLTRTRTDWSPDMARSSQGCNSPKRYTRYSPPPDDWYSLLPQCL